jgi:hypothetical protein
LITSCKWTYLALAPLQSFSMHLSLGGAFVQISPQSQ